MRVPAGIWISGFILCLVIMVVAGGCLGTKASPPVPQTPPVILVDYQRTGGIAGFNDRLVIFDNGDAIISGTRINREMKLNRTELDRLNDIFTGAHFSTLEGNYTAHSGTADVFHYSISYYRKTVYAEDTALPTSLQPVIDELNRILSPGVVTGPSPGPFSGIPTL